MVKLRQTEAHTYEPAAVGKGLVFEKDYKKQFHFLFDYHTVTNVRLYRNTVKDILNFICVFIYQYLMSA